MKSLAVVIDSIPRYLLPKSDFWTRVFDHLRRLFRKLGSGDSRSFVVKDAKVVSALSPLHSHDKENPGPVYWTPFVVTNRTCPHE